MSVQEPSCSFCHRAKSKVQKIIAGDGGVYICNYCIALCYRVLIKEGVDMTTYEEGFKNQAGGEHDDA